MSKYFSSQIQICRPVIIKFNAIIICQDTNNFLKSIGTFSYHFLGHYDKCVSALREKHKDDMAYVTAMIFSHGQVAKKNLLVTMLVDHLWANEPGLTDELAATLNELTTLNRSEHSRVALRARQV